YAGAVDQYQVSPAVSIEVGRCYREGILPSSEVVCCLEGVVPVTQENTHAVVGSIGHSQVQFAVMVEVARSDCSRRVSDRVVGRAPECNLRSPADGCCEPMCK